MLVVLADNVKNFYFDPCKPKIEKHSAEAALQRSYWEKVFWKYAANLQENTHAKVLLQEICFATLLKSHFGMGVLL